MGRGPAPELMGGGAIGDAGGGCIGGALVGIGRFVGGTLVLS